MQDTDHYFEKKKKKKKKNSLPRINKMLKIKFWKILK